MWDLLKQSDFDNDPLKMRSRIANWNPLARKLPERNIINDVLYEKNDTVAAAPELAELPEELVEIPRTKCGTTDSLSAR
jgi:hypothetical protein